MTQSPTRQELALVWSCLVLVSASAWVVPFLLRGP